MSGLSEVGLLRQVRKAQGMTQAVLAAKARVSERTISRIELGRLWPRRSTCSQLERALGQTFHWPGKGQWHRRRRQPREPQEDPPPDLAA